MYDRHQLLVVPILVLVSVTIILIVPILVSVKDS